MNCSTFKEWLVNSDAFENGSAAIAMTHIEACPDCKQLYDMDQKLESRLRASMTKIDVPERLLARIENDRKSYHKKLRSRSLWVKSFVPMAFAAMLILFIFPSGEKFVSADQVADYAVYDHINHPGLAFKTTEMKEIPEWFEKNSGYKISIPENAVKGFELRGGTPCKLGKNKAAFLCLHKKGKRYSLFVISLKDIGFNISEGETLTFPRDTCKVNIWKESGMLYAMVE